MRLKVIDNINSFIEIESLWNQLYDKLDFVTPFQSWEWNFLYWKYFQGDKLLQILTFEDGGSLLGVLPFCIRYQEGLRILEPIGTRGTDYVHLLLNRDRSSEILENFILWFNKNSFDLLNLEDIPETAPYINPLIGILKSNELEVDYNKSYCPCYEIELPKSRDAYLNKLSKRRKKDTAYYRRYVSKSFKEVSLACLTPKDLEYHFELHQKSRQLKNDRGTYVNDQVRAFMRDFANTVSNKGLLKVLFLSLDKILTASILGVEDKNRRYDITIGYDPKYAKYRPGSLLYGYDIEDCITRNVDVYDLSRGLDAYKTALGAKPKSNVRIVAAHSGETIEKYFKCQKDYWKGKNYAPTKD
ncbi:MAG: GNAT family N-acetyltransferase [Patescibacteria group bacterium]